MKRLVLALVSLPRELTRDRTDLMWSLGVLSLAAYLRRQPEFLRSLECDVLQLDAAQPDAVLLECLRKARPDMIGFSCYVWNRTRTLDLIRNLANAPGVPIIVGGPESADPEPFLRAGACAVIRGEGEETLARLLKGWLEDGAIHQADGATLQTSKGSEALTTPPPVPLVDYPPVYAAAGCPPLPEAVYLETTRGCFYQCSFCTLSPPYRRHSRPWIEDEVAAVLDRPTVRRVEFVDAELDVDAKHLEFLLGILKRYNRHGARFLGFVTLTSHDPFVYRELREAGFNILFWGIQTASEDLRRQMGRAWAKELRIETNLTEAQQWFHGPSLRPQLIFGFPGDSLQSYLRSLDWCQSRGIGFVESCRWLSLPGTRYRREAGLAGIRYQGTPFYQVLETPTFKSQELEAASRTASWYNALGSALSTSSLMTLASRGIWISRTALKLSKQPPNSGGERSRVRTGYIGDNDLPLEKEAVVAALKHLRRTGPPEHHRPRTDHEAPSARFASGPRRQRINYGCLVPHFTGAAEEAKANLRQALDDLREGRTTLASTPVALDFLCFTRGCNIQPPCPKCVGHPDKTFSIADARPAFDAASRFIRRSLYWLECPDGEPLMNPSFTELVKVTSIDFPRLSFPTNGVLLTPKVADVLPGRARAVLFSVDSWNGSTYARLQGKPRQLDRVMANVEYLVRCRAEAGASHPKIYLNHVLTRSNMDEFIDFCSRVNSMNVDGVFVLELAEMPNLVARRLARPGGEFRYAEERLDQGVVQDIVREGRRATGIPIMESIDNLTTILPPGDARIADCEGPACCVPWLYLGIYPTRYSTHCCYFTGEPIGRWETSDIEACWNGPTMVQIREEILSFGLSSICLRSRSCPLARRVRWLMRSAGQEEHLNGATNGGDMEHVRPFVKEALRGRRREKKAFWRADGRSIFMHEAVS